VFDNYCSSDITAELKDNRNLCDLDSNQKLKQEEIEQMKRDGLSGDVSVFLTRCSRLCCCIIVYK